MTTAIVKTAEEKPTDLDDVLKKFNIFDSYHRICLLLIFLTNVSNSISSSNYIFVAERSGYRCKHYEKENSTLVTQNNSSGTCTEWEYDDPHSFFAEFQLGGQEWKQTLVGTIHSFGYMIGLLILGPISDRWGRKHIAVITSALGGFIGVIKSFSTSYWLYVFLEFLEPAIGDSCSPIYILTVEIVSSQQRVLFFILTGFGFTFGGLVLPTAACLVPYWRNLCRTLYSPALLYITYAYFLDESPRWLLTKGKKQEAIELLEKAAKKNKIKLDKNALERLSYEPAVNCSMLDLLKSTFESTVMIKRFLICLTWWITSTFVNYGLSINSVLLPGNKYLNYASTSLTEIPGNFIIAYTLKRFNRKIPLIFCFIFGAIFCITQAFIPLSFRWLVLSIFMAGKFMGTFFFNITYMFTSELFPTYTRNSMQALCSSIGRIGSIIAPQTPLLMSYWPSLPSIIFGSVALFAGFVTMFIPDVSHESLPDTVAQAEAIGNKEKNIVT